MRIMNVKDIAAVGTDVNPIIGLILYSVSGLIRFANFFPRRGDRLSEKVTPPTRTKGIENINVDIPTRSIKS